MHRIFFPRFLTKMIHNQKIVIFFIWIFLILDLKIDNRVILHFYDEINYKETNLYSGNSSNTCFSKFVKKKFDCYIHNKCLECSQFIIEDENDFPLNFNNKKEIGSDYLIFINTKVMKFKDFVYFFNVIKEKSELKENFQMCDFLLIIRILDVFKVKKNRNFSQIIRTLLLSIILKDKCFNINYSLNTKISLSSSMLKTIFIEFGKIYFLDTSFFLTNTSCIAINERLNENSCIDFKITAKFFCINSNFIAEINKRMKFNKRFLTLFRIIFKKLEISRAILYGGYNSCPNISFHLPYILFSNIYELCFYSWEDMNFFNFMCENSIYKNLRILTFINCYFFSFSEGIFDNLKSLQCINCIDSYIADPISSSKLNAFMEIFIYFYSDITNEANSASFLELASNKNYKFENIDIARFFDLNKSLMTSQEFKSSAYRSCSFNELTYMSSCFGLYAYVSNSQMIQRLSVVFKEISLRGLTLTNPLIYNNTKELSIWDCEFSNEFLRDILLIPSLEKLVINNCKALFVKNLTYKKRSCLTNLSISGNSFENSDEMINFLTCLSNLKILDFSHNKNLNLFESGSINKRIVLESLESLILFDEKKSLGYLPDLSGLKTLKKIRFNNGWHGEGSLMQLLIYESLADIRDLYVNMFKIGIKDNGAMIRCEKIQELYFFDCEFINITFSQLFDTKKTYLIEKLVLEKILLTILDILFISNLFYLKYLQLEMKGIIDTKPFYKIISVNKSKLQIKIKLRKKNYRRQINYFMEIFRPGNQKIYEF